jgi:hypothetical protein
MQLLAKAQRTKLEAESNGAVNFLKTERLFSL